MNKAKFDDKMDVAIMKDRMLGCLYGQAVGDALGLGSEFMSKEEVKMNS